ncbi:MAG: hypothetical protein QUS07_11045 [Methanothrix sp.]|nr:hypothetical protein [Methanothrix sp.]
MGPGLKAAGPLEPFGFLVFLQLEDVAAMAGARSAAPEKGARR